MTRRRRSLVRPPGWTAPGPRPRGADGRAHLFPGPAEDLCALTGDFHLFQLRNGHRWSIDDLLTAWAAVDWIDRHGLDVDAVGSESALGHASAEGTDSTLPCPSVLDGRDPTGHDRGEHGRRQEAWHLDLGCGIGSVLLMMAWAIPRLRSIGIEAQPASAALARRSIEWNGVEDRVEVLAGDLRAAATPALAAQRTGGAGFVIVTGTPPYFPTTDGVVSDRPQRGPCRFELRGGVEDYAAAAARVLAPRGVFVVCETTREPERAAAALRAAGLVEREVVEVIPKQGKPPLFTVHIATWPPATPSPSHRRSLTIRDEHGHRTPEARLVRARMGIPW